MVAWRGAEGVCPEESGWCVLAHIRGESWAAGSHVVIIWSVFKEAGTEDAEDSVRL